MTVWRKIPGYAGYFIDATGRVLSRRRGSEKLLKPGLRSRPGYRYVVLWGPKGRRNESVSRLVLRTFCRPPRVGEQAAHLNGNSLDNRAKNLIWTSAKINCGHRTLHKRCPFTGVRNPRAKLTPAKVRKIRKTWSSYSSIRDVAKHYDVTDVTIYDILNRVTWKDV
jgi:hypothetical protein